MSIQKRSRSKFLYYKSKLGYISPNSCHITLDIN